MKSFAHIDSNGNVKMVDVTNKDLTSRIAKAQAVVCMSFETLEKILNNDITKGNVLETARIAGIMAAKKTSDLIPLCHPLNITHIYISFFPDKNTNLIKIESNVSIVGQTGVEMESLTAVSVAALTIYDMCKSVDKGITITDICLLQKEGGKSGVYLRQGNE